MYQDRWIHRYYFFIFFLVLVCVPFEVTKASAQASKKYYEFNIFSKENLTNKENLLKNLKLSKKNISIFKARRLKNTVRSKKSTYDVLITDPLLMTEDEAMNLARSLKADPSIQDVILTSPYFAKKLPNDPLMQEDDYWKPDVHTLWPLFDMNFPAAWDVSTGSQDIVVAVIDFGFNIDHPDLEDNLWINVNESESPNGGDDDANRKIDDINGFNFISGTGNLSSSEGSHGNMVAGLIAAKGNNNFGMSGGMWNAKIMPLVVCFDHGFCPSRAIILAVEYAIEQDVDIINLSLGSYTQNPLLEDVLKEAYLQGITIVGAAGNENSDAAFHYPSAYPWVVSVGAYAPKSNEVSSFSNKGPMIDVFAPGGGRGGDIRDSRNMVSLSNLTTFPGGGAYSYDEFHARSFGTSFATPLVSAVAGLILSENFQLDPELVRQKLRVGSYKEDASSIPMADAYQALQTDAVCEGQILNPYPYAVLDEEDALDIKNAGAHQSILSLEKKGRPVLDSFATISQVLSNTEQGLHYMKMKNYDSAHQLCAEAVLPVLINKDQPVSLTYQENFEFSNVLFGSSLSAGDVNGDGFDDLLVGAPNCDFHTSFCYSLNNRERAFATLVFGSENGLWVNGQTFADTTSLRFESGNRDTFFGRQVKIANLDGDDYADVIISSPHDGTTRRNAGRVCIYLGQSLLNQTGSLDPNDADYCFRHSEANRFFGSSFDIGDWNGDGLDDIVTGGCYVENSHTRMEVHVFYSSSKENWLARSGVNLADLSMDSHIVLAPSGCRDPLPQRGVQPLNAGDLNGDGHDDLLLAVKERLFIYFGPLSRHSEFELNDKDVWVSHESVPDCYRWEDWVVPLGDRDGDGFDDLAVKLKATCIGYSDGYAYIKGSDLQSGRSAFSYAPDSDILKEVFPGSMAKNLFPVGDLNDDGMDEALVVPRTVLNQKKHWLLMGSTLSLDTDYMNFGSNYFFGHKQSLPSFMSSLSIGDFNGNGRPDIVVSEPSYGTLRTFDIKQNLVQALEGDFDSDGFLPPEDCDNLNSNVNPEQEELPNLIDDNCNGTIDEGTINFDDDGDTFNELDGDCDDSDPEIYPESEELCDQKDNDCNEVVDDVTDEKKIYYYRDADQDGWGSVYFARRGCYVPTGWVLNNKDCHDGHSLVNPDQEELCSDSYDNNCDGQLNEGCTVNATVLEDENSNENQTSIPIQEPVVEIEEDSPPLDKDQSFNEELTEENPVRQPLPIKPLSFNSSFQMAGYGCSLNARVNTLSQKGHLLTVILFFVTVLMLFRIRRRSYLS